MPSRPFDAYDGLAAAQVPLYTVFLAGAVLLCLRHDFRKSSGWRYLLVLSLVRVVGASLRLATLAAPTDRGLYTGWAVLSSLGMGPLVLTLLALLSRAFQSMRDNWPPSSLLLHRATLALMLVAIVLLVIGGVSSSGGKDGGGTQTTLSHVGSVLLLGVFALLCAQALLAWVNLGRVAGGERRVVLAVVACLPFVLVRLVYGIIKTFTHIASTAWLMLGMEVAMEVVVVLVCEVVGFTLAVVPEEFKPVRDVEAPRRCQHQQR
ncbi:hypothetical protein ISF_01915 [Cordyceps fumosorosea ARSEF 2679]|uniref:DUF7702 domain-containing protein n=1 Tax=Cordyceps fumosorosea (strain ARSEF 2679) TaxID=1081104 RepID=A0A162LJE5_CORFA|nr:hypothetical protein ISF_01915 [Cordyceps fumosorosea ARSEF 2679]OAA71364.1 hypothetical protein ISF_01915 [Cordyceps fumosorosea ARSEF 2679]